MDLYPYPLYTAREVAQAQPKGSREISRRRLCADPALIMWLGLARLPKVLNATKATIWPIERAIELEQDLHPCPVRRELKVLPLVALRPGW